MTTDIKPNPIKKTIRIVLLLALLLAGIYFGFKKYKYAQTYQTTDNAQVESNAAPILSRIAGYVDSVMVKDFDKVQQGQIVAIIDSREIQIAIAQAEADLAQANADLAQANADLNLANAGLGNNNQNINVANATVQTAKIRKDKAFTDYDRDQKMFKENAITKKQLEDTKANFEIAEQQYKTTLQQVQLATSGNTISAAQIQKANAQIQKANALVQTRTALLKNVQLKLSYSTITAIKSGKIGKKNIEVGQYVQPGQPLMTIVDNERYWIVANFKETQLSKIKEGQKAILKIDGYEEEIEGSVIEISDATGAKFSLLPPDNATGNFIKVTQRVPVKIAIHNFEKYRTMLRAGVSVEVAVKVK